MTRTDASTASGPPSRSRGFSHAPSFWIVAGAFLVTMAFSLVPTPLWTLYQQRDGFDTFMITVVFAVYALGVITSLLVAGRLSDRFGRRTVLMPAILLEVLSAVLFIAWNDVTGLIIARVISGLGIGLLTTSATVHLLELHLLARPGESRVRADIVSTAANLGGFAVGALVSGLLVQFVPAPLYTPYLTFLVLLTIAAVVVSFVPETLVRQTAGDTTPVPSRRQGKRVPREARRRYLAAGALAFGAFGMLGMFAALASSLMGTELRHTSPALTGAVVAVIFVSSAGGQLVVRGLNDCVQVRIGMALMVVGTLGYAGSLPAASPVLLVVGGVIAGAGAGVLFKQALGLGASLAHQGLRGEALAGLLLLGYLGLALAPVGIGVVTLVLPLTTALVIFSAVIVAVVLSGGVVLGTRSSGPRGDSSISTSG
jgi:MFS family permease